MSAFCAFTKKELTESIRTYRLVVLAAVFFLLGVISPLIAKIMPELFSGVDLGGGVVITAPEPTAMDSWAQFYSNVGQMGMLTLIITFAGIMANEFSRGTLVHLLSKGMKRSTVILSKWLFSGILWTGSYLLCLLVCYAYTEYIWPAFSLSHAGTAFFLPWLFGEFLIALLIFGGVLFGSLYGSLLTCGGVVLVLNLLNIIPRVKEFNPIRLTGDALNLLSAQKTPADFMPAAAITAAATAALIAASIALFNKKRI